MSWRGYEMKRHLVFLLMASVGIPALAESVSAEFQGVWGVDGAATATRIAADPDLSEENKTYWAKRFTDGQESKLELHIAGESLEILMPGSSGGLGPFAVTRVLEESPGRVSVSSLLGDPRSGKEIELVLDLQIHEDGTLSLQMDSGGAFDDNDLDPIMWVRSSGVAVASGDASGDPVQYLDSLRSCEPGEFRFTGTGLGEIRSSIVGREGDRCRVITETAGHRVACDYSDATIALLTSQQKYEDARNGILQGSTDSEESSRVNEECGLEPETPSR